MAKHKRILQDGQTSRGPARWFRAADNAMRKPTSPGGKLFWGRASTAHLYAQAFPESGPYEHMEWSWRGQRQFTRAYVTCSNFCMAMQVQLDWQYRITGDKNPLTFEQLLTHVLDDEERHVRPATITRAVRCQFCSSQVAAA